MKKKYSGWRLYVLMRNDLPSLNPGKAMAHAAHAANQFTFEYGDNSNVKRWQQDANGFGTTVCLSVNKAQLEETVKRASRMGWNAGLTFDPEYAYSVNGELAQLLRPCFVKGATVDATGRWFLSRKELTCGYLFIADESTDRNELVGAFPLHP